jgi:hypothetical protein
MSQLSKFAKIADKASKVRVLHVNLGSDLFMPEVDSPIHRLGVAGHGFAVQCRH